MNQSQYQNYRILRLQAENVKRLKVIDITPEGNTVLITGANDQGKSSVLDSIIFALGGKSEIPTMPIRDGEEEARIIIDLGEYEVTRHWTSNEKTYLKITRKDGKPIQNPQLFLDGIIGKLSFDPLEYSRLRSQDQRLQLLNLLNIT